MKAPHPGNAGRIAGSLSQSVRGESGGLIETSEIAAILPLQYRLGTDQDVSIKRAGRKHRVRAGDWQDGGNAHQIHHRSHV